LGTGSWWVFGCWSVGLLSSWNSSCAGRYGTSFRAIMLARVDRVLDLSWLHDEVAAAYAPALGRPAVDPEAALRLMLSGFLLGIVHDRRLMREAQVNLAIRWFAGFGLRDRLPDHSSLTRIRQRWGAERF